MRRGVAATSLFDGKSAICSDPRRRGSMFLCASAATLFLLLLFLLLPVSSGQPPGSGHPGGAQPGGGPQQCAISAALADLNVAACRSVPGASSEAAPRSSAETAASTPAAAAAAGGGGGGGDDEVSLALAPVAHPLQRGRLMTVEERWERCRFQDIAAPHRELWAILGWNAANWEDPHAKTRTSELKFSELGADEALAARCLGYSAESW